MDDEYLLFGVTPEDWARTPESVQTAFLTLLDLVKDLTARMRTLEAQVGQTSRNSSKPPSSDPPSAPPRPPAPPRGKRAGAQPGHPDQQRPWLPPDQVDTIVDVRPTACPHCTQALPPDLPTVGAPWACQVWEIPPLRPVVTEYRQHTVCCPSCQHAVFDALPPEVAPGAFGPRATALIGLLHGRYRLSMRETADCLAQVWQFPVSLGSIATSCQRVSHALTPVYQHLRTTVAAQASIWMDETRWREGAQRPWLWVATTPVATVFQVARGRSQQTRQAFLGDQVSGIIHSDRAHAYGDLPLRQRQVCWAHLIRNWQAVVDQQQPESPIAQALLACTPVVFQAWQAYRADLFDLVALQQALIPVRHTLRRTLEQGAHATWSGVRDMCRTLLKQWDALWTFTVEPGCEPTNNRAEQAIRPAVLWRKGCFGTQSTDGSRFVERILSVTATCRQQQRSVLTTLSDALVAAWTGRSPPILAPLP